MQIQSAAVTVAILACASAAPLIIYSEDLFRLSLSKPWLADGPVDRPSHRFHLKNATFTFNNKTTASDLKLNETTILAVLQEEATPRSRLDYLLGNLYTSFGKRVVGNTDDTAPFFQKNTTFAFNTTTTLRYDNPELWDLLDPDRYSLRNIKLWRQLSKEVEGDPVAYYGLDKREVDGADDIEIDFNALLPPRMMLHKKKRPEHHKSGTFNYTSPFCKKYGLDLASCHTRHRTHGPKALELKNQHKDQPATDGKKDQPAEEKHKDTKRAKKNAENEQIWPFNKKKPAAPAPKSSDDSKEPKTPSPYVPYIVYEAEEFTEEEIIELDYHFPGKIVPFHKIKPPRNGEN